MVVITRVCKKCKEEKILEDFSKSNECKDGRRYTCKLCMNKKYKKKGPCSNNPGWYKKGHECLPGSEKGWFKKGERRNPETEFKKGQQPHNFIDGKSEERYSHLNSKKLVRLRKEVRNRDGNRCVRCKAKTEILHVHHIIPLRVDMTKAYDLDNLMTVCPKCHVILDNVFKESEE
jgi:hypothetical protein